MPRWLRNAIDFIYAYRFIIPFCVMMAMALISMAFQIYAEARAISDFGVVIMLLAVIVAKAMDKSYIRPRYELLVRRDGWQEGQNGFTERLVRVHPNGTYAIQHVFLEDHVVAKLQEQRLADPDGPDRRNADHPLNSDDRVLRFFGFLIGNKFLRVIGFARPFE